LCFTKETLLQQDLLLPGRKQIAGPNIQTRLDLALVRHAPDREMISKPSPNKPEEKEQFQRMAEIHHD
jgi:hypothetical protein